MADASLAEAAKPPATNTANTTPETVPGVPLSVFRHPGNTVNVAGLVADFPELHKAELTLEEWETRLKAWLAAPSTPTEG
jgi:hypothetical protein